VDKKELKRWWGQAAGRERSNRSFDTISRPIVNVFAGFMIPRVYLRQQHTTYCVRVRRRHPQLWCYLARFSTLNGSSNPTENVRRSVVITRRDRHEPTTMITPRTIGRASRTVHLTRYIYGPIISGARSKLSSARHRETDSICADTKMVLQ
jgi:hypothetical protein